uniref:Uncharacterized protein n=1 Tax=Megaselia scalaris TaxID=36166 RepID=T1H2R1_MEGSC
MFFIIAFSLPHGRYDHTYMSSDDEPSIIFRLMNSCLPYGFFAVVRQLGTPIGLASPLRSTHKVPLYFVNQISMPNVELI